MKRSLRICACLAALCLLATALTACGGTSRIYASPGAQRTVATVGEEKISYAALYCLAMNRQNELKATYGEHALDDPARRAEYEAYVWENLLDRDVALRVMGAEYGLDVNEGDIAEAVDDDIKAIISEECDGDTKTYAAMLNDMYLTDRYLRVLLGTEEYLPSALVVEMLQAGVIDGSDATAEALIASDAFVRTYHVFISRSGNGYDEATNRAHADAIRDEVAAGATAEERFNAMRAAIGGAYNNDYGDTTGNGYYFAVGEMESAYEAAALALDEDYAVSPVVETAAGFYIILRCPKDAAYIQSHFQSFKEKFYFIKLNAMVEERLPTLTLQKTKFGANLDLTDLTPVRANGGTILIIVLSVVVGCAAVAVSVFAAVRWRKKRAAERAARRPVHSKKKRK